MKITVKDFIRGLIGNFKELQKSMTGDGYPKVKVTPMLKFTGKDIIIYTKEDWAYPFDESSYGAFDGVSAVKIGKKLVVDLGAINYWNFSFEFSDGGLIKNKEYKIEDYFKK
jgi:hypothetical protein